MKYTDKFVLVPVERYDHLMKENASRKNVENSKKEPPSHQKGGGRDIDEEEIKKNPTKVDKVEEVTADKKDTPLKKGEEQFIKKIPAPPPGIPNKIKKEDFKWIVLFK